MGSLTVSYGGNTIHTSSADETFTLQTSGKYASDDITLTGTDVTSMTITYGGQTIDTGTGSFTHKLLTSGKLISGDIGIAVVMAVADIKATVDNLGASSPATVTFTKDSGFTVAGLGIEEVTFNGDVFIKIPTMYRKVNTVTSNQITSFTIANKQIDSNYQPYPCFVAEDGITILPYILIGKYWNTSSDSMISTTTGERSMVIGDARTKARNRGTGYLLYDWQIHRLWQDLIIIFMDTVNTNNGVGITYDSIGLYWGTSTGNGWVDGISANSNGSTGVTRISYKPSKYVDNAISSTAGYIQLGYKMPTSSNEVKTLGYDINNPFVNFPSSVTYNSSYNTYYCDDFGYDRSAHPVEAYVSSRQARRGAFALAVVVEWASASAKGRLCYRPIS